METGRVSLSPGVHQQFYHGTGLPRFRNMQLCRSCCLTAPLLNLLLGWNHCVQNSELTPAFNFDTIDQYFTPFLLSVSCLAGQCRPYSSPYCSMTIFTIFTLWFAQSIVATISLFSSYRELQIFLCFFLFPTNYWALVIFIEGIITVLTQLLELNTPAKVIVHWVLAHNEAGHGCYCCRWAWWIKLCS